MLGLKLNHVNKRGSEAESNMLIWLLVIALDKIASYFPLSSRICYGYGTKLTFGWLYLIMNPADADRPSPVHMIDMHYGDS